MLNKPYSEACDQNRQPILDVIQPLLHSAQSLLEIGSGTGQHAVYFAEKMPHLTWQSSDQTMYHAGIQQWIDAANVDNVLAPLALNVSTDIWMSQQYDAVFSANTLHIMSDSNVYDFFTHIDAVIKPNGLLLIYGPFNYQGHYSSASNARFDQWLKSRDALSGIKDFESINALAEKAGFTLQQDYAMPANNRILCWKKHL
jgi:cyclopropane fatty-acyl-phospholipid synthase-like methyltransferase